MRTSILTLGLLALLGAAPLLSGCGGDAPEEPSTTDEAAAGEDFQGENVILYVLEDAGLTTFRTLVSQGNLEETFGGGGPFTVFAPSDEAFQQLPEEEFDALLADMNQDRLREILLYHVVPREIPSGELAGTMTINTVQGQPLTISATGGEVTLTDPLGDTATIVTADLEADNGVIHMVDRVLYPGEADAAQEAGADTGATTPDATTAPDAAPDAEAPVE